MLYRQFATEAAIDAEYNPRLIVPDAAELMQAYQADSAAVRARLANVCDIAYGPSAAETLDLFPARETGAPVHVFIHGGYWRAFTAKDFSFVAEAFVAHGVTVAIVNYALCPEVTIGEIVRQCRAAVTWVARNVARHGGDPGRIGISGHSAGGHLVGMMLATDWAGQHGLPEDVIKTACPISGLFDLGPFPHSFLQPSLRLDNAQVAANSPLFLPPRARPATLVTVGGDESAEFRRQSGDYAAHLAAHGIAARFEPLAGRNHFTVLDDFRGQGGPLCEAILALG